MPNFKRIKKLRDHIASLPESRFDMSAFAISKAIAPQVVKKDSAGDEFVTIGQLLRNGPSCRTACCLAGDACLLFMPKRTEVSVQMPWYTDDPQFQINDSIDWHTLATDLLQLTSEEAQHMFMGEWAGKRQRDWDGEPDLERLHRRHAIKYLDLVLATRNVMVKLK